jgi:2-hydroxychromene-2-carboxylate isomerase
MPLKTLDFWFDFASHYSYLAAMRVEGLAGSAGIVVRWQPFLLGPIFQSQGWATSPFNLYPVKGAYAIRDIQRIAARRGLDFCMPNPFPQNSLMAARAALVALDEGWGPSLCKANFAAQFGVGESIADAAILARIIAAQGHDSARVFSRINDDGTKQLLHQRTLQAQTLGLFGAPTFRTADGELFWGDDRLRLAVSHAQQL